MCALYVVILLGKKRERERERASERERERERVRERERERERKKKKRRRWMKVVRRTFSLMIPSTFLSSKKGKRGEGVK